jgi:hypothetical protein
MIDARAFELYLMSLMRGNAAIESTLDSLGLDAGSLRAATVNVETTAGFLNLAPRGIEVYTRILGTPVETIPEREISLGDAFAGSQRHRFHLLLWPGFDLILRTHPAGWVWGPQFVRRQGASLPAVANLRDLQPWTIVEPEVVARFGPFKEESAWNLGKDATYVAEEADGEVEVTLVFDLSLLQNVQVAPVGAYPMRRKSS